MIAESAAEVMDGTTEKAEVVRQSSGLVWLPAAVALVDDISYMQPSY